MAAIAFVPAAPTELPRLAALAKPIWEDCFTPIIGKEQVAYMVRLFQSLPALRRQTQQENYQYYFIQLGGKDLGYTGVQPDPRGGLFLSKLYLKAEARGRGYARQAFCFLCGLAKEQGLCRIWLTVNKHNAQAIAVYEHLGFVRTDAVVTDIGGGFVMDDYIYSFSISHS
ncbi:MAG: GNAT family N-acetyltransferase [Oscillospiraceae bacterium]|nr:GNAT family N-acetyltransferase [Oscillospiraceae bacterium]